MGIERQRLMERKVALLESLQSVEGEASQLRARLEQTEKNGHAIRGAIMVVNEFLNEISGAVSSTANGSASKE